MTIPLLLCVFGLHSRGMASLDLANFLEKNLIESGGSAVVPPSIPYSASTSGTVIFGDEIIFDGGNFHGTSCINANFPTAQNAAQNIVVVADTIRLQNPCTFDLSGGFNPGPNNTLVPAASGSLTLVANHIVIDPSGNLAFKAFGLRGENVPPGKLRIFTKRVTLSLGKEEAAIEANLQSTPFNLLQSDGTALTPDQKTRISDLIRQAATSTQSANHDLALVESKSTWDNDLSNLVLASRREAARNSVRSMEWKSAARYGIVVTPVPPLPPGLPPEAQTREIPTLSEFDDVVPAGDTTLKTLMSAWKVRELESVKLRLTELAANSNWPQFGEVASRLSSLQSISTISGHAEVTSQALQAIQGLLDHAPLAIPQSLDLEVAPGVHEGVSVLTLMSNRSVYAVPDMLLLESIQMGSTVYSGLLRQRQDFVEIQFSGRFAVSPPKERALRAYLAQKRLSYGGLATQLPLTTNPITFPGISPNSSLTVSGNSCSGSLVFQATNSVGAMAQLAGSGIPVTFQWKVSENGRSQAGDIAGLTISRSRVDYQALRLLGDKVEHILPADHPRRYVASPRYVALPDGSFAYFAGASPSIAPGQSAMLPAAIAQKNPVAIPPEAVVFDNGEDIEPSQAFRILSENDLVRDVTISDLLPENDTLTNSPFSRLELRIANLDNEDREVQVIYRTIGLREQIKVPFVSNFAVPKTRITGTVFYLNGGHVDLKPWTANSALIDITPDHLMTSP